MPPTPRPASLHLLGGFELRDSAGHAIELSARKSRLLLAHLAVAPGRAVTREHLAALLWADRQEEQARGSLRSALSELRRVVGAEALAVSREGVALRPDVLPTDYDRLKAAGKPPVEVREVPENLEDDDLLEMANVGLIKITVVDNFLADFWKQVFTTLTVHDDVAVRTGGELAVAIRKNSPELAAGLNAVIAAYERGRTWSLENPDELAAILAGAAGLSDQVADRQLERTDLSTPAIGEPQRESILGAGIVLQEAGVIEDGVDVEATVDDLLDEAFTVDLGDGG